MRLSLWPDSSPSEIDGLLNADTCYNILLAELEGDVVGFAEIGERIFADGCTTSPVSYLEGIWVEPERRRAQVASALIDSVVEWSRQHGYSELASDCELLNEASAAFHVAVGFKEVSRNICFAKRIEPDSA